MERTQQDRRRPAVVPAQIQPDWPLPVIETAGTVDVNSMLVWLRNLGDFFGPEDDRVHTVRDVLRAAAAREARVGIRANGDDHVSPPDDGRLVGLDANALVIQLPRTGIAMPIVGEHLHLTIEAQPGFDCCEVRVEGHWERNDGTTRRSGIRVSLPELVEHIQRRQCHRLTVAFDLSPKAEAFLVGASGETPLGRGDILDVSEEGMRLRIPLARELAQFQQLRIVTSFPDPFPSFEATAEVVHAKDLGGECGEILGLRFLDPKPDIGQAIHLCEMRRARRQRR